MGNQIISRANLSAIFKEIYSDHDFGMFDTAYLKKMAYRSPHRKLARKLLLRGDFTNQQCLLSLYSMDYTEYL